MKLIDKITIAGVEYTFGTIVKVEKSVCDLCDLNGSNKCYIQIGNEFEEFNIAICDLFQRGRNRYVYVKKNKIM